MDRYLYIPIHKDLPKKMVSLAGLPKKDHNRTCVFRATREAEERLDRLLLRSRQLLQVNRV